MIARKFIGRIGVFIIAVVVTAIFAGCAMFEQNLDHDYGRVVVMVGSGDDKIQITKKELYDAFQTSGGYYLNYGLSVEDTYERILDSLINREIAVKLSVAKFGRGDNAGLTGMLTKYEADAARKSAFDSFNSGLKTYIDEDSGVGAAAEEEEPKSDAVEYTPYEKYIEVNSNHNIFTLNLSSYESVTDIGDVAAAWTPDIPADTNTKVAKKALARIIRNLETKEKGFKKLRTDFDRDKGEWFLDDNSDLLSVLEPSERNVLNREMYRIIMEQEKNTLAERLQTCFELGIEDAEGFTAYIERGENSDRFTEAIKANNGTASRVATGIANSAVSQYKTLVKQAIANYKYSPPDDMEADLISSVKDVYYVPHDVAKNLFTVSHILVGFSDEQKAELAEINSRAAADSSFDKDAAVEVLRTKTMSGGKNVYDIYNEVNYSVNAAESLSQKHITFRDLIYKYNTDPGMQNPEFEYVMSTNSDKNQMIPEFTEESIKLKTEGQKGDISGLVWGEYGAHIIMYTRDVSDFIYTNSELLLDTYYDRTLFASQTSYNNKTMFDVLAEGLKRDYSKYETALFDQYKGEHKTTVYKGVYKDLLK